MEQLPRKTAKKITKQNKERKIGAQRQQKELETVTAALRIKHDLRQNNTYFVIQTFLDHLKRLAYIKTVQIGKFTFLCDFEKKKAIMEASVSKPHKKKASPPRNKEFPHLEMMATSAVKHTRQFLRLHHNFTVAVGCGNMIHETLLFIRRIPQGTIGCYSLVHFNPNWQKEISSSVQELIQMEDASTNHYTPGALRHGLRTMNIAIIIILTTIFIIILRSIIKKQRRIRSKKIFLRKWREQQTQNRQPQLHELEIPSEETDNTIRIFPIITSTTNNQ